MGSGTLMQMEMEMRRAQGVQMRSGTIKVVAGRGTTTLIGTEAH